METTTSAADFDRSKFVFRFYFSGVGGVGNEANHPFTLLSRSHPLRTARAICFRTSVFGYEGALSWNFSFTRRRERSQLFVRARTLARCRGERSPPRRPAESISNYSSRTLKDTRVRGECNFVIDRSAAALGFMETDLILQPVLRQVLTSSDLSRSNRCASHRADGLPRVYRPWVHK